MSIVRKFQVSHLKIEGVDSIDSPVYPDHRGTLYEAFHCLKADFDCSVAAVNSFYPRRHVVYGLISIDGDEIFHVIRGKLIVVLIDPKDHKLHEIVEAGPGKVIKIPSGVIRGYLALEEDVIYNIVRTSGNGNKTCYKFDDPEFGVKWPESELPLTQAPYALQENTEPKPKVDFAIIGSTGQMGSAFIREIEARGMTWAPIRARLNQHERIRNEILAIDPQVSVICAAGLGTRPNTKWCDEHRLETLDVNVTCYVAISRICRDLKKHCTFLGTAAFYAYDDQHPIGGKGFTEEDEPNHLPNYYYKTRQLFEKILKESDSYKFCLNLRGLYPIDHTLRSSSLVSKLLKFETIYDIPSSITVLNQLVPLAIDLMVEGATGNVNWVTDGTISNGEILKLYKEIVDPEFTWKEKKLTAQESREIGNCAAYVVPERLLKRFGDKVPKTRDAVIEVFKMIKANKH
ncbi:dTDP-D-glucose 4,6-dehydratase, putative [Trichomonas vaginalis G3]|uniref:dTDP-D-glucose 4,6-dehydratase, putative n=1 Tax=Trichomonas vaginalis (strain ATCC PRA-98 / G3) TaxID=412133 RepID=A2DHU3_TRIV3|nr:dTDP-glucose 4,6-dehydratase protein [Trichomonas vaginalis G3]EAY19932.1 dTDP-D-glucose 4,6-dehydratase, putative [Trichomonas vaginalis G3]KAI5525876.1 dTDP-glucose 4,6-dehydratase protein [Trichomonas vaginalis G3]|eukprot:XP_001580918.1 dTDP-D-glucose 4,6-dehydratase [Trichomonas vaginalis G3]